MYTETEMTVASHAMQKKGSCQKENSPFAKENIL